MSSVGQHYVLAWAPDQRCDLSTWLQVPCMASAHWSRFEVRHRMSAIDRLGLVPACLQKQLTKLFLQQRPEPSDGGKQTRFALDTHQQRYYHVPTAKIDLTLSASAEVRQELFSLTQNRSPTDCCRLVVLLFSSRSHIVCFGLMQQRLLGTGCRTPFLNCVCPRQSAKPRQHIALEPCCSTKR